MIFGKRSIAIVVTGGLLAALFLFLGFREIGADSAEQAPVLALQASAAEPIVGRASRAIEVGETISGDMIVNEAFDPARHASIGTPAELIGKVAIRPIPADTLVDRRWVDLQSNLAIRVPIGKRAVSIDTNSEIAVAGLLRPGNVVDVQVVYPGADAISGARLEGRSRTETVLQAVQVLAVGEAVVGGTSQDGVSETAPARTVTLALTPDDVAVFSLAKNTGVILLSLRNPRDDAFVSTLALASDAPARSEPVRPLPPPVYARPSAAPARSPRRTSEPAAKAELIIGGRRETLFSETK